jgi:MoxR-like ATPase
LAKTSLVRVFAMHLHLQFGRVQFTPDLLPSDIIGSDILNIDPDHGRKAFEFSHGPIFVNLLLADEINRASPRTQSALLEAMQERTCTVGGKVHVLPDPFMVFATQNPFESEGAFPLPEAQLDRFLLHALVDYPDSQAEEKIWLRYRKKSSARSIAWYAPHDRRIRRVPIIFDIFCGTAQVHAPVSVYCRSVGPSRWLKDLKPCAGAMCDVWLSLSYGTGFA